MIAAIHGKRNSWRKKLHDSSKRLMVEASGFAVTLNFLPILSLPALLRDKGWKGVNWKLTRLTN